MTYVPNPPDVQAKMLQALGLSSKDELFADIPPELLIGALDIDKGKSELELKRVLGQLAAKNLHGIPTFLGAGAYDHFIPSAVDQIVMRSEFYTSYTPYQAELSQGILQSIFEYQTYICTLTGMDVSNASVYDGASAVAEACSSAAEATRRKKILVPDTLHPAYRAVLNTYAAGGIFAPHLVSTAGGQSVEALAANLTDDTAAVVIQHPNFYGALEKDIQKLSALVHEKKGLLIMVVDPISLGMLKNPGELGADIAVGEGQSLGMNLSFGGPYLGFFATTEALMRRVPGRIVGQTTDITGQRAFVLTLQAREQHIRRERALSNICSNQALNALAATIYLGLIGATGLQNIARRCHYLASYAQQELEKVGLRLLYNEPFFKEFAVKVKNPAEINKRLLEKGIIGGYELPDGLLLAFTEKRTKEEIDQLVAVMGGSV